MYLCTIMRWKKLPINSRYESRDFISMCYYLELIRLNDYKIWNPTQIISKLFFFCIFNSNEPEFRYAECRVF